MKKLFIALLVVGCSKLNYLPNPNSMRDVRTPPAQISVLYDSPARAFESLGVISAHEYQPGISDPDISEVAPKIKAKASAVGGDAVIIRNSFAQDRKLVIEAEVIRFTN